MAKRCELMNNNGSKHTQCQPTSCNVPVGIIYHSEPLDYQSVTLCKSSQFIFNLSTPPPIQFHAQQIGTALQLVLIAYQNFHLQGKVAMCSHKKQCVCLWSSKMSQFPRSNFFHIGHFPQYTMHHEMPCQGTMWHCKPPKIFPKLCSMYTAVFKNILASQ